MKKTNPQEIRLAHLLSQRGVASRRAAEVLIVNGRVSVDGEIVTDPAFHVNPSLNRVEIDGNPLPDPVQHRYIALNKPAGYLSGFVKSDEKGGLLGDLVEIEQRLFPVGRLDRSSRGLLLLTTDGDWANLVMHPRYEKEKEYLVRFRGVKTNEAVRRLRAASIAENDRTFKAHRVQPDGSDISVILKEGRNRQIRRLAEAAGLRIADIIRIRIGPVKLGRLKEGHWRNLNSVEVSKLG